MPSYTKTELAFKLNGPQLCQTMLGPFTVEESKAGGIPNLVQGAGFKATLDFMVRVSGHNTNDLLESLLTVLPEIQTYSDFLNKLPKFELTPDQVEYLAKMGHIL